MQQAPDVAHVEEVRTSCDDMAAASDSKPVIECVKRHDADTTTSSAGSSSAASTLQQSSSVPVNTSVNGDRDSIVASCSEMPQSSTVATNRASLTASSASDEKPVADADDDNPELTVLVASYHLSHTLVSLMFVRPHKK